MKLKKFEKIKYILPTIAVIIIIAVPIIYTNNQSQMQRAEEQQSLQQAKEKQSQLDAEFAEQQQAKEYQIQSEQTATQTRDQDGDGLTYAEEIALGTSDTERDTDADGISDPEDAHPAGGGELYTITVHWTHAGLPYTTQFGIPEDRYLYYKNYPREGYYYQDSRFAIPNDPIIQTIAQDITDVSISTGDTCKNCIAVDFVESMIYQYDIDYISKQDYPKYAIETIIDQRGDCEDTSFLMASILEAINIDTVLLLYSDHMAVGIYCTGCTGTYYNYNGRTYFFLETTGHADNWQLGQIWGKYAEENPRIIPV